MARQLRLASHVLFGFLKKGIELAPAASGRFVRGLPVHRGLVFSNSANDYNTGCDRSNSNIRLTAALGRNLMPTGRCLHSASAKALATLADRRTTQRPAQSLGELFYSLRRNVDAASLV